MKKAILTAHRYLGMFLSLIFVIWFLSGFVMIFYSFPRPDKKAYEQLNKPLNNLNDLQFPDSISALTLETHLEKPIWRTFDLDGKEQLLNVTTLQPLPEYSEQECRQMAQTRCPYQIIDMELLNQFDMWIPWESYQKYFPIYKFSMSNPAKTCLYVSSRNGDIVQETNRETRLAAYFGAIPHWVYIKQLRLNAELWKNSVIVLSALGSLMCIFGLISGIQLYRKSRKREHKSFLANPYKKNWYKWHYWLGLIFGLISFTYVFSGMMSLCEVPQFIATGKGRKQMVKERGVNQPGLTLKKFTCPVSELIAQFPAMNKIEWVVIANQPFYRIAYCNGNISMIHADSVMPVVKPSFEADEVVKAFKSEIGEHKFTICLQNDYDNYYRPGSKTEKPLPVYRLNIGNAQRTSLYINPVTAQKVAEFTSNSRVRRWVYQFLHSFDTPWLLRHPNIRLILEFLLMTGGTLLSATSIVLLFRRLKRRKHGKEVAKSAIL